MQLSLYLVAKPTRGNHQGGFLFGFIHYSDNMAKLAVDGHDRQSIVFCIYVFAIGMGCLEALGLSKVTYQWPE